MNKIPPHDLEAEGRVLGSILLDPNTSMEKVEDILEKEDFYSPFHKIIYEGMCYLYKTNIPISTITLLDWGKSREYTTQFPTFSSSLIELEESTPSVAFLSTYIDIVKKKRAVRKVLEVAVSIEEMAYGASVGEVDDFLEEAEGRMIVAAQTSHSSLGNHAQVGVLSFVEKLQKIIENPQVVTGVPSGFGDLDKITLGFQRGDFIVLAARPSMGKSSLAMQMAFQATHHNKKVGFISLEMSEDSLIERLISMEARVTGERIKTGNIAENEVEKIMIAASKISESPLYISDDHIANSRELRRKVRRLVREKKLDIVFIDYIQLIRGGNFRNREEEVANISSSCKILAKELKIPIVGLAQLNRLLEQRQDKRPLPSDLRESGSIEADADLILFIYRDEVYRGDSTNAGVAEILISKHRNGPTGMIKLVFQKEFVRFAPYVHF